MRVEVDSNGPFVVRLPVSHEVSKIADLSAAFLRQEDQVEIATRTVYTEDIRVLSTHGGELTVQTSGGESQRKVSSEELKRLETTGKKLVTQIQSLLKATFIDTPEQATEWGFEVTQTGQRAGTIRVPQGRDEITRVLAAYVVKELSRPIAEQFRTPVLTEVQAVSDGLNQSLESREAGKTQREMGTAQANSEAEELLDLLQAAALQIVIKQYGRKVTPALQQWGFDVVARTTPPTLPPPPAQ